MRLNSGAPWCQDQTKKRYKTVETLMTHKANLYKNGTNIDPKSKAKTQLRGTCQYCSYLKHIRNKMFIFEIGTIYKKDKKGSQQIPSRRRPPLKVRQNAFNTDPTWTPKRTPKASQEFQEVKHKFIFVSKIRSRAKSQRVYFYRSYHF